MRKTTLILILIGFISCNSDTYEEFKVDHIDVKIDKRIAKPYKDEFLKDVEYQVSENGWAEFSKIKRLTLDSIMFSYLLTVDSEDTVITEEQGLLKAYGEDISKDIFNSKPVHFFSTFTNQYFEYDTTSLISSNDFLFENDKLKLYSYDVDFHKVGALDKIINRSLSKFSYSKPFRADLAKDSILMTLDLTVDTTQIAIKELKNEIANIDPFLIYLAIHRDELLIKYKDSLGREIINGNYFK